MWVSPARHSRRAPPVAALAVLALLLLAACGPKGADTTPVPDPPPLTDEGATGSLAIIVEGLNSVAADIMVTGPSAYTQAVTGSITLEGLEPGEYTVKAAAVTGYVVVGDDSWSVLVEDDAEVTVTVRYSDAPAATLGSLEIRVEGLSGVDADITVTGPEQFDWTLTGPAVLSSLPAGDYTVTAAPVADFVVVGKESQTVAVAADAAALVSVRYSDAALAVSGAAQLEVPLQRTAQVGFTVERRGTFTGPVSIEIGDIPGLSVSPLSGTLDPEADTFAVTVGDDGAAPGDYELSVTVTAEDAGRTLTHSANLSVSLAVLVTDGSDRLPDLSPGSLRALLQDARTEGATISFDPTLFADAPLVIRLADTLLLEGEVEISGPAWSRPDGPHVRLEAAPDSRVLLIGHEASVGLSNVQVNGGREQNGAGIMVTAGGSLNLQGVLLTDNHAERDGGAIWSAGDLLISDDSIISGNHAERYGGGIYVAGGKAVLDTTEVEDNSAANSGGGIMARDHAWLTTGTRLEISRTAITANSAINGGGLHSYVPTVISRSSIRGNSASQDGAGIRNHAVMEVSSTFIEDNHAVRDYGGLFSDGILTVTDSTVADNSAGGNGGGISNGWYGSDELNDVAKGAIITRAGVTGNTAGGAGGGIYSVRQLQVIDSHIQGNTAEDGHGGGIYAVSIPHSGAPKSDGGTLLISGSMIEDNEAPQGNGGGIYSGTVDCRPVSGCQDPFLTEPNAPFHLHNSTLVNNTAQWGGGIGTYGPNQGEVRLNFNTIMHNTATGTTGASQGGGVHSNRDNFRIRGNIIAQNSVSGDNSASELYTSLNNVISDGYNFLYRQPDGDVVLMGTDIAAGSLEHLNIDQLPRDNGGLTPTLALNPGSHYGDHVPAAECLSPTGSALRVDQRGERRPGVGGTGCSIGAYELQGAL